ncbi:MAG: hypothetical protein LBH43_08475 [Treponema sp.]|nr:hypothetical protein [Treponema sp.]
MAMPKIASKTAKKSPKKVRYDFKDNNPKRVLTRSEVAHLDECMRFKNSSIPADEMDTKGAAESVMSKMERKYS